MKTGWKTQLMIVVFLFFSSNYLSGSWLEVVNLETNETLYQSVGVIRLNLKTHQVVGLNVIGHFNNATASSNYTGSLKKYWKRKLPSYVEGWEDQSQTIAPGKSLTLQNTIYIRPLEAAQDTLSFWCIDKNNGVAVYMIYVHIIVEVEEIEAPFSFPVINPEPEFTSGLSNTIYWQTARGAAYEDPYYFDVDDPDNLKKAVQKLYRSAGTSANTKNYIFENLENGHTYGYFVKSVFEGSSSEIPFYSDFVYSTQDNTPPNPIGDPQAIIENDNTVVLTWKTVEDDLSGVDSYIVYRSIDTGVETVLDTVLASSISEEDGEWIDSTVSEGFTYHYRVRPVDGVGNLGNGNRSNGVTLPGDAGDWSPPDVDVPEPDTDHPDGPFIQGPVDTVWVNLDGRELKLRFESVRDSAQFFNSPPSLGMRYFDSGWVSPTQLRSMNWVDPLNPDRVFFVFDYTDTGGVFIDSDNNFQDHTGGIPIDANFVNGHTYLRRVIRKYFSTTDITYLDDVIPDCFAPNDIRNLKVQAVIEDAALQNPLSGYSSWHLELSWEPAADAVSGIKRYRVYRKLVGIDPDFVEMNLPDDFLYTFLIDSLERATDGTIVNPLIQYKVVAEDYTGNVRSINKTEWMAEERSLWNPTLSFYDTTSAMVFLISDDTLFTQKSKVSFNISDFETKDVLEYEIFINDQQRIHRNRGQDTLCVPLPSADSFTITVRAIYLGKRSSLWTEPMTVLRALNLQPTGLVTSIDEEYWKGNIHLQWNRGAVDAVGYEIWRKGESGVSKLIGTVESKATNINWTDFYDIDELTGQTGDVLTAYENYTYKVREINVFDELSTFSSSQSVYCNRPPLIVSDDPPQINDSYFALTIHWQRISPNLVANGFKTEIRVSNDSLDNVVATATLSDDELMYTFLEARSGHNYIFQVREIPNLHLDRPSAWSQPYTISSLVSLSPLVTLPQPTGHIYVDWENPDLVQKYHVNAFRICRDTTCWILPSTATSYMDSSQYLEDRQIYEYRVMAFDSLNQVVAANSVVDTCDKGSAFIPEIEPYVMRYFHSDSIEVSWVWKNVLGTRLENSTRGATTLQLQVSVSRTFPTDPEQTLLIAPFAADPHDRSKVIPIPPLGSRENETIYFRITAHDLWGHPFETYWSDDFYELKTAIYDPVVPYAVSDLSVSSLGSYYGASDRSIVRLQWSGQGVEWLPQGSNKVWGALVGNIHQYHVIRKEGDIETIEGVFPVQSGIGNYIFQDTTFNRNYQWHILAVDSALNTTAGEWMQADGFVTTPEPPIPVGNKECMLHPVEDSEYFVEIATDRDHFRLAYEIDNSEMVNRFLCQSGWIDNTQFVCTTGWGSVVVDTTWFRVKIRQEIAGTLFESAWSNVAAFHFSEGTAPDDQSSTQIGIPEEFGVNPNYPNPFNIHTMIPYQLPEDGYVKVNVYNTRGALVQSLVSETKTAGYYSVVWDGQDRSGTTVASGIYMVHVQVKTAKGEVYQEKMKMMLIK